MNYALIPGSQVSPRYLMLCGLSHGQPPRENVKYSPLAFVMQNGFKASYPRRIILLRIVGQASPAAMNIRISKQ